MSATDFIWQDRGTPWRGVAIYHVTASAVHRHPIKAAFGELKWSINDGQIADAHVEWSPLGQKIWNCIQEIHNRYPQIRICAARIMPDHLHMVLYVTEQMDTTFNLVLRGWVQGCKRAAIECGFSDEVFADKPFIRVMTHRGQLRTMAEYVQQNPLRMAVRQAFPNHFVILRDVEVAGQRYAAVGNLYLLYEQNMWQVHVHKEWVWDAEKGDDRALRDYKNRCIIEARNGAVLVSPFINPHEQDVLKVALKERLPMIYILDNGLPDRAKFKPSGDLIEAVGRGELLLLSPWEEYVPNRGKCTREECIAMNKMAEAIQRAAMILPTK